MEFKIVRAYVKYYIEEDFWDTQHNCFDYKKIHGPFESLKSAHEYGDKNNLRNVLFSRKLEEIIE